MKTIENEYHPYLQDYKNEIVSICLFVIEQRKTNEAI